MKNNTAPLPAAPDFPRNATWLNTEGLSMQSLAGKVVLLHFWDYTSVCCLEAMPYIRAWHSRYTALGLALVGVHTPEFPFARTRGAVRSAVTALELHYPILLDNKFDLWKAYGNTFWPSYHLIDAHGVLRYSDVGEGAWLGVESVLQDLLREAGATGPLPDLCEPLRPRDEPGVPSWPVTANVYTGYDRGSIGNSEGSDPHRVVFYEEVEGPLKEGSYYLEGKWLNHRFCAAVAKAAEGTEASIHVPYTAAEVCMVVNPSGDQGFLVDVYDNREPLTEANAGPHVRLVDDGEEHRSQVLIHDPKVYRVIKHDRVRSGVLKVTARSSGFTVYAFTFLSSPFKEGVETSEAVTALIEGTAAPSMEESVLGVVPEPELPTAVEAPVDGLAAGSEAAGKRTPRAPKGRGKAAEPASSPAVAGPSGEVSGVEPASTVAEVALADTAASEASAKSPARAPKAKASRSTARKAAATATSDAMAPEAGEAAAASSASVGDSGVLASDLPPGAAVPEAAEAEAVGRDNVPDGISLGATEATASTLGAGTPQGGAAQADAARGGAAEADAAQDWAAEADAATNAAQDGAAQADAATDATTDAAQDGATEADAATDAAQDGAAQADAATDAAQDGAGAARDIAAAEPQQVPASSNRTEEATAAAPTIGSDRGGDAGPSGDAAGPAADEASAVTPPKRGGRARKGTRPPRAGDEATPEAGAAAADPKQDPQHGKRGRAATRHGSPDEPRILIQLSRPRKRTMRRAASKADVASTKRAKSGDATAKLPARGLDAPKPRRQARTTAGTNGDAHKEHETPAATPPDPVNTEGSPAAPVEA